MPLAEHELDTSVTLAHDYLLVMRGAERTFAAIADCYPSAPIFTLLYDEQSTHGRFAGHAVHTSPLGRLGVGQRHFRRLLPLYPWAVGRLALPPSDVVLSSDSARWKRRRGRCGRCCDASSSRSAVGIGPQAKA